MPNRRFITCQSDSSVELRTETLEGRQHLIVPIIGLIGNTIINPANAPSPEYVPLSVLEEVPEIWNNRIVVPLHPMRGDHYVSANDPEMTDKYKFGVLFNSRVDDGKLKFDAWLDIDRANTLGGLAQNVIERLNNNEPIEISTGCLVEIEEIDNSDEYGAIWRRIESDHLAMLPEGTIGACSISMGCGAPRLNERRVSMKNRVSEVKVKKIKVGPFKRLLSTFKPNERQTFFEDGATYHDLMGELTEELRKIEPALDWVIDTNIKHDVIYYMTYSIQGMMYQGSYKWYRRTYTLDVENFTVVINDDAVEVEPIQRYQAVEETTTSETRAAIQENPTIATTTVTANQSEDQTVTPPCSCNKGENAMKRKDLVDKIMAAKKLKDSERAGLEALSEETLAAIAEENQEEEAQTAVQETPPATSSPVVANASQVTISAEELSHLRSMAARLKAQEDEKKSALITQILANERGKIEFTKEELAKLDIVSLERNVRLLGLDSECGAVDYSTLGTAVRSNKKEVYKGGWSAALEETKN